MRRKGIGKERTTFDDRLIAMTKINFFYTGIGFGPATETLQDFINLSFNTLSWPSGLVV